FRIPLRAGRDFGATDGPTSGKVAIVDERMARRYWPDTSPIGRRLAIGGRDDWLTVVRVPRAATTAGIRARAAPHLYVPLAQRPSWTLSIVLRSRLPEATLNDAARAAVRAVDPGQPLFAPATMDEIVGGAVAQRRFTTMVLVAFAATALGLA